MSDERGLFMAVSDSRRRANNKWDAANMTTLGCRMKRSDAEDFKAACKDSGTTPNAVFNTAVAEFMQDYEEEKLLNGGIKHGTD
nr:MAG TPA: bifunctional protein PutA [Caudoviricetes sp.]